MSGAARGLLAGLVALAPAGLRAAPASDVTPPSITHVRVSEAPRGQALVIEAGISDESAIFAPAVYVRRAGEDEYVSIAMTPVEPGRFAATVPAARVTGILEYFIEAFDELGNGPSRAGTPDAPLRVSTYDPETRPLPEPEAPPGGWAGAGDPEAPEAGVVGERPEPPEDDDGGIASTVWFWTLVGTAVAAGGALGAYYLVEANQPCDPCTVTVVAPDPAAGL
jgi:hypothetical protein